MSLPNPHHQNPQPRPRSSVVPMTNPPPIRHPAGTEPPQDFEFVDCATLPEHALHFNFGSQSCIKVKKESDSPPPISSLDFIPPLASHSELGFLSSVMLDRDTNIITHATLDTRRSVSNPSSSNTPGNFSIKREKVEQEELMEYEPFEQPSLAKYSSLVTIGSDSTTSQNVKLELSTEDFPDPTPLVKVSCQSTEWGPARGAILSPVSLARPPVTSQSTEWGPARDAILNPMFGVPSQSPEDLRAIAEAERHLQQVEWHPERGYRCHLCPSLFKNKPQLQDHILRAHLHIKNFSCGYCGLEYHTTVTMFRHHKYHHKGLPLKFERKIEIKKGKRVRRMRREKPVASTRYTLTMQKPENLGVVSKYKKHMDLLQKEYEQIKEVESKISRIKSTTSGYVCYLCNYNFRQRSKMKLHIIGFHLQIRRFQCKYCVWKCFQKSSMINHYNNLHPNKPQSLVLRYQFNPKSLHVDDAHISDVNVPEAIEYNASNAGTSGQSEVTNSSVQVASTIIHTKVQRATQKMQESDVLTQDLSIVHSKTSQVLTKPQKIPDPDIGGKTSCTVSRAEKDAIRETELKIRKLIEHPQFGFRCYVCSKYFSRGAVLRSHILHQHFHIKEFTCTYCPDLQFYWRDDVREHHNSKHRNLPLVFVKRFRVTFVSTLKSKQVKVYVHKPRKVGENNNNGEPKKDFRKKAITPRMSTRENYPDVPRINDETLEQSAACLLEGKTAGGDQRRTAELRQDNGRLASGLGEKKFLGSLRTHQARTHPGSLPGMRPRSPGTQQDPPVARKGGRPRKYAGTCQDPCSAGEGEHRQGVPGGHVTFDPLSGALTSGLGLFGMRAVPWVHRETRLCYPVSLPAVPGGCLPCSVLLDARWRISTPDTSLSTAPLLAPVPDSQEK